MKAKDYRLLASDQCKKYSGELVVIQLLVELIALALSLLGLMRLTRNIALISVFATIETIILLIITGPLNFSIVNICEKVKNGTKPELRDLLYGFSRFSQAFIVDLLKSIFIFLWSLLLIVPGIIKAYSYALTDYIAYDDPNITSNEAITKSREMMNGYKWRLFCLEISYIGWILLVILTIGILGLWVMPKINQAKYNFYLNLVKQNTPKETTQK